MNNPYELLVNQKREPQGREFNNRVIIETSFVTRRYRATVYKNWPFALHRQKELACITHSEST